MFKAAFFDIDGTLVSFNTHRVPESTIRAIDKLKSKGIKCFVSTGRHISKIDNLGDLEFDGYVTVNGGINYYQGQIVDTNPIDKADIRRALDIIYPDGHSEQPIAPFATAIVMIDDLKMNYVDASVEEIFRQLNFKCPELTDLRKYAEADIFQMISFFDIEAEPSVMNALPHCQSERWSPIFTDVVPKGQSKPRGMKKLCEIIGAEPSEVIAFGDGGNDTGMLQFAGMGVAMGNAQDTVKAYADMVCPSVDEDGIEWAVDKILSL